MSSIRRSIQAMDLLARKGPLGVRAVALQLGLPLGSVHRLLLDLAEEGVVERTPDGRMGAVLPPARDHRPAARSPAVLAPGSPLRREASPRRRGRPSTSTPSTAWRASASTRCAATRACSSTAHRLARPAACRGRRQGDAGLHERGRPETGHRGGAACCADAQDDHRPEAAPRRAHPHPPARLFDRRPGSGDRASIASAMPILDRNARPVGALSITGPSPKRAGPEVAPLVAMLSEACGAISRRLGYTGAWPLGEVAPSLRPACPRTRQGVKERRPCGTPG